MKRIQRQRTVGSRLPKGATYVGRPSRWGNPFPVDALGQQGAVDAFAVHIAAYFGWEDRRVRQAFYPWPVESGAFEDWIGPLRGRDLACWCSLCEKHRDGLPFGVACPDCQPCHADLLGGLAG